MSFPARKFEPGWCAMTPRKHLLIETLSRHQTGARGLLHDYTGLSHATSLKKGYRLVRVTVAQPHDHQPSATPRLCVSPNP